MNLNNLDNEIKTLEEQVSSLKGKMQVLNDQYSESTELLFSLKTDQILNTKAIELLNFVQKATSDLIKEMFENIITHALQYVYQDNDYKFGLKFDKHGNNPKLTFLLQTPDMQEEHDILSTRAGGSKDIIALALRLVLLEVSKNPGFLFLDEPEKRLKDSPDLIKQFIEFIKETQQKTNRQIIMITHDQNIVDSVPVPIVMNGNLEKNKMSTITKCPLNSGQIEKTDIILPKKRGRPKKEKQENA